MAGTTTSTVQQTRQQLDELDALLQKMLASPSPPPSETPTRPTARTPPPVSKPQSGGAGTASHKPAADPRLTGASFVTTSVAMPGGASAGEPPAEKNTNSAPPTEPWTIDLNPRAGSSVLGSRSVLSSKSEPATAASTTLPELPPTPIGLKITVEPPAESATVPANSAGDRSGMTTPSVTEQFLRSTSRLRLNARQFVRWWATQSRLDLLGYGGLAMTAASFVWGVVEWFRWTR